MVYLFSFISSEFVRAVMVGVTVRVSVMLVVFWLILVDLTAALPQLFNVDYPDRDNHAVMPGRCLPCRKCHLSKKRTGSKDGSDFKTLHLFSHNNMKDGSHAEEVLLTCPLQ